MRRALAGIRDVAHTAAVVMSLCWFMPPPATRPLNELAERMHRQHVKLVESIDREALRAARQGAVDAAAQAARYRRGAGWFTVYTGILTVVNVLVWMAAR